MSFYCKSFYFEHFIKYQDLDYLVDTRLQRVIKL